MAANVSRGSIDLLVPAHGFMKSDTLCAVFTLQNAVIQGTAVDGEINVRIEVITSLTYGSGFVA